MSNTLTAIYDDGPKAAAAVDALLAKGVDSANISVVASEDTHKNGFEIDKSSRVGEGAAIGGGAGGALGALVAGFTSVGALITGGASLVATGPIIAALAGAGAGAAAGSATGGAIGAFIPDHEIKNVADEIADGRVLVGVNVEDKDQEDMVNDVFDKTDARQTAKV